MVIVAAAITSVFGKPTNDVKNVELRMPQVQPQVPDIYLCHAMKAGDVSSYISGFIPHGDMRYAHHMLLFGCKEPGSTQDTWNCGEMHGADHSMAMSPPCSEETKIIYAWAMDAPELKLPEGVSFHIGGDSEIQYVVLQIHYTDVTRFQPPHNEKDSSGVTLFSSPKPTPRLAGVYLLATGGDIPAQSTTYLETACPVEEDTVMHPFAYRVHAHTHGQVTAGYRIRDGKWVELGRQSPQKAQMFYPVTNPDVTVTKDDILAARCTMVNNENRTINIGSTQHDEMCNFYIMYWVDGETLPEEDYCVSDGDGWSSQESVHIENLPADASVIPGSNKLLQATHKIMKEIDEDEEQMQEDMEDFFADLWQPQQDNEEENSEENDNNENDLENMAQYMDNSPRDNIFEDPYNRVGLF